MKTKRLFMCDCGIVDAIYIGYQRKPFPGQIKKSKIKIEKSTELQIVTNIQMSAYNTDLVVKGDYDNG